MKKFNIEEFEFSQSYLFFWDKVRFWGASIFIFSTFWRDRAPITLSPILLAHFFFLNCLSSVLSWQIERCYFFLHAYVETAQKKEPMDGRLLQFILSNPANDGGQWDMLVNLIG